MKNIFLPILLVLCSAALCSAQQVNNPKGNVPNPWDFKVEFEPIIGETAPGLHSFAYATYGSKWVFIGGRTNGLHGQNANTNFETEHANNRIVVLDTTDWQWTYASLSQLPLAIADPLRSTNMEYWQDSTTLYMVGGYGWDSTLTDFTTYPTLSAIDVPGLINAVELGDSIYPFIRQHTDTNLAVAGGELIKMDSLYYLVMGHKFTGRYSLPEQMLFTQTYTNAIRHFGVFDDGDTLYIKHFAQDVDTNNFHRRDLNAVRLDYTDSTRIAVLGGVFQKNHNMPFYGPIVYDGQNARVDTNITYPSQQFNQYTNAHILIKGSNWTYSNYGVVMLGGMGSYYYNDTINAISYDTLVPFSKTISLVTIDDLWNVYDSPLGYETHCYMPGFLGSNAVYIKSGNLTPTSNGAIVIEDLPMMQDIPRKFVGYLFGGIRGTKGNYGPSSANDTIYRLYIHSNNTSGIKELPGVTIKNIYPNPGNGTATLTLSLAKPQKVKVTLWSVSGAELQTLYNGNLPAGVQNIPINAANIEQGLYLFKIDTPGGTGFLKYSVVR